MKVVLTVSLLSELDLLKQLSPLCVYRYDSLSDLDLLKLPVPALASDGCLVVVWVTNKQRQQQFVIDQLFPAWGVKHWVRWYWLKVCHNFNNTYILKLNSS